MLKVFEGSTIGYGHTKTKDLLIGKPNQDSVYTKTSDNVTVSVVCDGCSQFDNNHFGAMLGSRLVCKELFNVTSSYSKILKPNEALKHVSSKLISTIKELTKYVDLYDGFMFTVIGYVTYNDDLFIFACGDGVYGYKTKNNDVCIETLKYYNNLPPYISKVLDGYDGYVIKTYSSVKLSDLEYAFVGSDGISDFIKLKGSDIPGNQKKVISIEELCTNEYYNSNRHISAYLKKLNLDKSLLLDNKVKYHGGLLPDDTTISIIKDV